MDHKEEIRQVYLGSVIQSSGAITGRPFSWAASVALARIPFIIVPGEEVKIEVVTYERRQSFRQLSILE